MALNSIVPAIAASVAMLAACLPTGARAQIGPSQWDKISGYGELVCSAMSSNPLGSWKTGPGQHEDYEINFRRRIAQDFSITMGKPIVPQYHELTWGTVLVDASLAVQSGQADALGTSILICLDVTHRVPTAFGDIIVPRPARPLPSSTGMRGDRDQRFNGWLSKWATEARATGLNRELLIDAMKSGGLDPAKLPPGAAS